MGRTASMVVQLVKNPPAMQETLVQFLGQEDPWRRDRLPTAVFLGFPGGSDSKETICNAGDLGLIPVLGRSPWRRAWQPTPIFLPGESHGLRSLAGYSQLGHQVPYMTERLSTAPHGQNTLRLVCVRVHSHVRVFVTPRMVAHQAPLSVKFFQARILEWVTISFSRASS